MREDVQNIAVSELMLYGNNNTNTTNSNSNLNDHEKSDESTCTTIN
jgi:hypothetical protein